MSHGIEAAGDIATGAMWARAVEPAAGGEASSSHAPCLNCGTALVGHYCHACGQSGHVHRTLMSIGHDLLHGVFHFEGRIWRTLPMLVLHPGALTRRYIAGERAKFVSPLALFLFTVFLMFAVFSATGSSDLSEGVSRVAAGTSTNLNRSQEQSRAQLAAAEQARRALGASSPAAAALDHRIASLRHDIVMIDRIDGTLGSDGSDEAGSSWPWFKHNVIDKMRANPGLVAYKVQSATYKFSWVLILLSTPFVALLFLWRRRFTLYDHATFVTYSISFMSLLTIALQLLLTAGAPRGLSVLLFELAPPVHMFAQLRGAYSLSIFSALWRTLVLVVLACIALFLFLLGIIALEVMH